MCICCAAIPIAAASGAALENHQSKAIRAEGKTLPRVRPILLITGLVLAGLMILSAILHTRYGFFW